MEKKKNEKVPRHSQKDRKTFMVFYCMMNIRIKGVKGWCCVKQIFNPFSERLWRFFFLFLSFSTSVLFYWLFSYCFYGLLVLEGQFVLLLRLITFYFHITNLRIRELSCMLFEFYRISEYLASQISNASYSLHTSILQFTIIPSLVETIL